MVTVGILVFLRNGRRFLMSYWGWTGWVFNGGGCRVVRRVVERVGVGMNGMNLRGFGFVCAPSRRCSRRVRRASGTSW